MAERFAVELEPGLRVTWDLDEVRAGLGEGEASTLWRIEGALGAGHAALRVLTGMSVEGTILLIAATRPADADGHDSEEPQAVLINASGDVTRIEEALVSTQYAADGSIDRVGLELYRTGEDYPLRGAGDTESTAKASHDGHTREGARLAFRLDGESGTALYEILHV
ncbi:MAG: hypothetical protein M3355_04640 [Actinomycetota bacterium]|nr:hypothetical protein [Actinomycetota bacterium]